MEEQYSKFADQDHKVKRSLRCTWLLPLLLVTLLLVVGMFVFVIVQSTGRYGCFCHGEKKIDNGIVAAPDNVVLLKHGKYHENITEKASKPASQVQVQNGSQTIKQAQIRVYGKILFPKDRIPVSLPSSSHLKVELVDITLQDVPYIHISSTEVDLSLYKKGSFLKFEIKCPMPADIHREYDLDAVLNMGWKPKGSDWLRDGDYFVDTFHSVKLRMNKRDYAKDIQLVYYPTWS